MRIAEVNHVTLDLRRARAIVRLPLDAAHVCVCGRRQEGEGLELQAAEVPLHPPGPSRLYPHSLFPQGTLFS